MTATQFGAGKLFRPNAAPRGTCERVENADSFFQLSSVYLPRAARRMPAAAIAKTMMMFAARTAFCSVNRVLCLVENRFIHQKARTRTFCWDRQAVDVKLISPAGVELVPLFYCRLKGGRSGRVEFLMDLATLRARLCVARRFPPKNLTLPLDTVSRTT
jgi:hypothetical protein